MQLDDINAIGLILQMVFTLVVLLFFGAKPKVSGAVFGRFLGGLALGFLLSTALVLRFLYSCDDSGNGPFYQGNVTGLCFALLFSFVPRKAVIGIAGVILAISGYLLCSQFSSLVNHGPYTYANTYTGKPVYQACSQELSAVHPDAVKRWHTPLTRIYGVRIDKQGK